MVVAHCPRIRAIIAEQSGMRKQQTRGTALCATRFMIYTRHTSSFRGVGCAHSPHRGQRKRCSKRPGVLSCNSNYLVQKFRLCLTAQCGELVHQHLFNEFTATHVARFRQLIQSVNGIRVQFQFDTLESTNFVAFKLITFINT